MNPTLPLALSLALVLLARAFATWNLPADEFQGILGLLRFLNNIYCRVWHRLEINQIAPLPRDGPAILISNHTCNIDHMLLQAGCSRLLGFMIAKEYFDDPRFHGFCELAGCIPVKRDGTDLAATRAALRALESGRVLPIFPEGRILPHSGRDIGEGKTGAAFIAMRTRAPVVPAYIEGTPATNQLWKAFTTPSAARITFGEPIDLSAELCEDRHDRESLERITKRLMGEIAALRLKSGSRL